MKECCGNCGFSKYDRTTGEYVCTCEESDAYALDIAFNDWCEEWSSKGN